MPPLGLRSKGILLQFCTGTLALDAFDALSAFVESKVLMPNPFISAPSSQSSHPAPASLWTAGVCERSCVERPNERATEAVSPHWLRHAHASHALDRGARIHLVQATLGHSSVAITSAYLHARPNDSSALFLDGMGTSRQFSKLPLRSGHIGVMGNRHGKPRERGNLHEDVHDRRRQQHQPIREST